MAEFKKKKIFVKRKRPSPEDETAAGSVRPTTPSKTRSAEGRQAADAKDVATNELAYHGEPPDNAHSKWTLRDIDELRRHPKQDIYFADQPSAQFKEFVEDIRKNGMREPIEILPDATVVSGHQRLWAARLLEWSHVPIIVRWDLAEATPEIVELALIEANRHRRQLSVFEQAKLFAAVRRLKDETGESYSRCELRDEYARRFGVSGRSLDRLLELVDLPIELQQAVTDKRLARQAAINLYKLDPEVYEPILQLIRDGKSVRKPVNRILLGYEWRGEMTEAKLARRLRGWLMEGTELEGYLDDLRMIVIPGQSHRLEIAAEVVQELLDALASNDDPQAGDNEVEGIAEEESDVEDLEDQESDEEATDGDDAA